MELNTEHKTIKIPEDIVGENLNDLGTGNEILNTTPNHDP